MEVTRIAINAQIVPGGSVGGVESFMLALISALGRLNNGSEEYVIIGHWKEPDWLKPYIGTNQRIVSGPRPSVGKLEIAKRALGPLRAPMGRLRKKLFQTESPRQWPEIPLSNGFYESFGCDVIHFPSQPFTLCSLPFIYNPHDLQHRHYPQFFTAEKIAWRETVYPAGCHLAHTIVVASHWIKQDIIRHYRVDPEKIQVIPWAPPTRAYKDPSPEVIDSIKMKYALKQPFTFYPAMTWEHKNHLRLLEALAHLRDTKGLVVRLVCTGSRFPGFWPRIEERINTLKLGDQIQFLGMVSPEELRAVYHLSQFVFVPTLFEAASGPVFEAWQESVPVACSTVTSLPEQAGDAALLFDPYSVEDIADALKRMATNENFRMELVRKGKRRLHDFDWERTAKAYRAVYRRAANRSLSDEDIKLLKWDWMRDPGSKEGVSQ